MSDAETIQSEKVLVILMRELDGDRDAALPRHSQRAAVRSCVDLLKQELTHQQALGGVSTFDKESLKVSELQLEEKSILPDAETIESEKSHLSHLT